MEDNEKKLAWVVDEGGNVHANSETLCTGVWTVGAPSVDAGSSWFTDEDGSAVTPIGVRVASGEDAE